MSVYKGNVDNKAGKGKVVYNVGIVKGIVRLAVEDVAGVAMGSDKKYSKHNSDGIKVDVVSSKK
ncbi:MAG: hypothetical protein J6N93_07885 [Clostridia bacterium]|nr:hypothetical protein [Clostridia bacterium]